MRGTRNAEEELIRLESEYKVKRKKLSREIYKSKQQKWRELVKEVQKDVWGQEYRIVIGKLKNQGLKISAERIMIIINQLFKYNNTRDSENYGVISDDTEVSISKEKVEQLLHEMKEKRHLVWMVLPQRF
ncbi:hypothetical protein HHI36_018279 [Cryptolaemus montrouzieri]|uniref:Uncharacterized protein n=1 Tax=Cryptolaemus montrouzieri TaxID=559131 RepID=A0ABD2P0F9_9CUCU